ncbi:hypothetical protein PtB15_2B823 [Puccinia triticina]|nr:hypothetical protein PtB15_2B823 [Puccinia triticina]
MKTFLVLMVAMIVSGPAFARKLAPVIVSPKVKKVLLDDDYKVAVEEEAINPIKACLRYDKDLRPTIPELLKDEFLLGSLAPTAARSTVNADGGMTLQPGMFELVIQKSWDWYARKTGNGGRLTEAQKKKFLAVSLPAFLSRPAAAADPDRPDVASRASPAYIPRPPSEPSSRPFLAQKYTQNPRPHPPRHTADVLVQPQARPALGTPIGRPGASLGPRLCPSSSPTPPRLLSRLNIPSSLSSSAACLSASPPRLAFFYWSSLVHLRSRAGLVCVGAGLSTVALPKCAEASAPADDTLMGAVYRPVLSNITGAFRPIIAGCTTVTTPIYHVREMWRMLVFIRQRPPSWLAYLSAKHMMTWRELRMPQLVLSSYAPAPRPLISIIQSDPHTQLGRNSPEPPHRPIPPPHLFYHLPLQLSL